MKRKIILALMTICILSFVSCGKQEATATTESIPNAVESAQVETTETTTETIESTEVVKITQVKQKRKTNQQRQKRPQK